MGQTISKIKKSGHNCQSMVLSPNADSSQRIFFSSNYKHLANEI